MSSNDNIKRYGINLGLILGVVLVMAIAAHFALQVGTRHGARCTVPKFTGISLSEAEQLAKDNDLKLHINDSLYVPAYEGGTVLDQLPDGGVTVKPGRTIYITINAFRDKMVPVPYVAGRSLRQAKNMLEVVGLEVDRLVYVSDMATNYVLDQYCEGKKITENSKFEVEVGTGVKLNIGVSEDDPYTVVPQLIGMSLNEAKSRIWESGLNVGKVKLDKGINLLNKKRARVYAQNLYPSQNIIWGKEIDIMLTLDGAKVDDNYDQAIKAEEQLLKEQERAADSIKNAPAATTESSSDIDFDNFFE